MLISAGHLPPLGHATHYPRLSAHPYGPRGVGRAYPGARQDEAVAQCLNEGQCQDEAVAQCHDEAVVQCQVAAVAALCPDSLVAIQSPL